MQRLLKRKMKDTDSNTAYALALPESTWFIARGCAGSTPACIIKCVLLIEKDAISRATQYAWLANSRR